MHNKCGYPFQNLPQYPIFQGIVPNKVQEIWENQIDVYTVFNYNSGIVKRRYLCLYTKKLNNLKVVTMMSVDKSIKCINAYPHHDVLNTFGEVIENNKLKSLRIAETSKYPHVNHFFDGDKDIVLKNTTRKEIKKKDVRTYDLYPPMSSKEVTDYIVKHGKKYDFI